MAKWPAKRVSITQPAADIAEFESCALGGRKRLDSEYGGHCYAETLVNGDSTIGFHLSMEAATALRDALTRLISISEHGESILNNPRRGYRSLCVPLRRILLTGHLNTQEITVLGD